MPTQDTNSKNIHEALLAVMGDISYVQKDKAKDGGIRYSIKSEESVLGAVRPTLLKHGIVVLPGAITDIHYSEFKNIKQDGRESVWNRVVAQFAYEFVHIPSNTSIIVHTMGEGADTGDKAVYKAMTGSKKYAILNALLLITGDDPDDTASPERPVAERPFPPDILLEKLKAGQEYFEKHKSEVAADAVSAILSSLEAIVPNAGAFTNKVFGAVPTNLSGQQWQSIGQWISSNPAAAKQEAASLMEQA